MTKLATESLSPCGAFPLQWALMFPILPVSTLREMYLRRLRHEVFEIVVDRLRKAGFPE